MMRFAAFWALFFYLIFPVLAQEIPDVPDPPRLVNDFTGVLSEDEVGALEKKLLAWEDSTSNQIAIVLVPDLGGMDVADYSVRLAEKWHIGTKKDNGLLLLLAMEERKSRIEVGYGLEGRITDAISRRILADYLKPAFREKRYYEGLDAATDRLIEAAAGEYRQESKGSGKKQKAISWSAIIIVLVVLFLLSRRGGGGGGGFLTGMLLGNMLGGRRSSWDDFSSGSGSFGGFGGGSFGGGGASGDW